MTPDQQAGRTVRIAFHTLGCRLNQYDTEVMKSRLPAHWHCQVVPWDDDADVYVLNSCTVTLRADQKARKLARAVKSRVPDARLVITGCYAQTQPEALAAVEEIDGVFGVNEREDIADWLPRVLSGDRPVEVGAFSKRHEFSSHDIAEFDGRTRAYVKVQDGCNLRCTYCLIWQARGPGRSRPLDAIRSQVELLAARGYPELVLAGVHLGSYGRDLGAGANLVDMLDTVIGEQPDLRFRLSSIHPNEVRAPLLDLYARHPNLQPYLHVSMQSGSDAVLRRMRRPYDAASVRQAVTDTAQVAPDFGIGADVIVGYPGETDVEFAETEAMIEALPFSYLHVFRYSPRPGTPAADETPVHTETVTARSRRLRELSRRKREAFESRLLGREILAVVESDRPESGWVQATTGNYATIQVPDRFEQGTVVRCRPEAFHEGVLRSAEARPVDANRRSEA